ncbi:uncharacterized protein LOC129319963 [Prosopis cineraria]|uniref:uncharacterized protein LOC129319963 n=1 Tax=Prosopis cineraria TaxID=364024 RepID=UPI00240F12C3|nr:uncharacterized protein LOC129319963 [Prosopis cineraria]
MSVPPIMAVVMVLFLFYNAAAFVEEEKHALIQSKWWNYHYSNDSYHNDLVDPCEWEGITCNEFGSIIGIWKPSIPPQQPRLADLNFTAFPNLKYLALHGMGLVPFQLRLEVLAISPIYTCLITIVLVPL